MSILPFHDYDINQLTFQLISPLYIRESSRALSDEDIINPHDVFTC